MPLILTFTKEGRTMAGFIETPHFFIPLSDGRKLSARMWQPSDKNCFPAPSILEYLPYRKRDGTAIRDEGNHPLFSSSGYVCIRVDLPGQGDSDGLMLDEYTEDELSSGEEIINWIARQKWSNGNIGMIGISWGGFNGLQIAMRRPLPLKAIVTVCSTVDRYADDIHYMGGCLLTDNFAWSQQMLAYSSRPPDPDLRDDWKDVWKNRLENQPAHVLTWLKHPTRDSFWKHGSVCEDWSSISCAVLAVGGWADQYTNAPLKIIQNLNSPCSAWIGPWEHKYPNIASIEPKGDFYNETLRWFDCYLKQNSKDHNLPKLRSYINSFDPPDGKWKPRPGRWIKEQNWPSSDIEERVFYLSENKLTNYRGLGQVNVNTPQTLGLTSGYNCPGMRIEHELPSDQSQDDNISICFDTEPLNEDLEFLGEPRLEIEFSVDKPVAYLIARICEVSKEGISERISFRPLNLTHYNSHEFPENLVSGKKYKATINLNHCGWRIKKGNKLRLALSSTYWPIIWPTSEVANIKLHLSNCCLILPQRRKGLSQDTDQDQNNDVVIPPAEHNWKYLILPSGKKSEKSSNNNEIIIETYDNFGHLKSKDHGLEHHMQVWHTYSMKEEDPLSARLVARWETMTKRDGYEMIVKSEHDISSDGKEFLCKISLKALLNNEIFHEKKWNERIQRRWQ